MALVDEVDWEILAELQADARLSYNELARRVRMSAPAVTERVRQLTRRGVITGYHAHVDPGAVGRGVTALVRLQCYGARCLLRDHTALARPDLLQVHRVTGDACCVVLVAVESMQRFETVIDELAVHGRPASTMVLSSPVVWRAVSPPRSPGPER
ncbi:Lrp/AsnC family transcriptional regulator [Lipingzhangella sp. LS1_29]|uniref:Lrp/AsnC family transcriptional regulator n=1 Tax=Lipingzhangella rawalii TaxID=2055835 RepID=A0ABU2H1F6_9ACTN|nr:Lrp/AsnC family transcriptional regulator [Lipingzhangella rawalii]MDS1269136.1 Lrp/AsnC family transcriptional regulator [Lipingzhangella rawalii]